MGTLQIPLRRQTHAHKQRLSNGICQHGWLVIGVATMTCHHKFETHAHSHIPLLKGIPALAGDGQPERQQQVSEQQRDEAGALGGEPAAPHQQRRPCQPLAPGQPFTAEGPPLAGPAAGVACNPTSLALLLVGCPASFRCAPRQQSNMLYCV